jgi:hypothetical protein
MRLSAGISTPNNLGMAVGYKVTKLGLSPLALFMARVLADHADNILPLHDLARFTKSFN